MSQPTRSGSFGHMLGRDEIVWRPSVERIASALVTRLMRKLGYVIDAGDPLRVERATCASVQRSGEDVEWFWEAMLADMEAAGGVPDALEGTEVVCFVVLHPRAKESEALRGELVEAVVGALGRVDRPKAVLLVDDRLKTRSAKTLRRRSRRRHLGEPDPIDLSSVANPAALDAIANAR